MTIDLLTKTSGTLINVLTIITGTTIGLFLKKHLPQRFQQIITQAVGLITVFIGLQMAGSFSQIRNSSIDGVVLGLIALAIGGLLGEWWTLEEKLYSLGNFLKARFRGKGLFTEGFVAASLLFCVGPMAIIGSINNGLNGNNTILVLKSTMDGLVSIALTSSFGIGVGFSVLVILAYQGGISLLAGFFAQALPNPNNDPHLLMITGVGGLTIVALGLNLLEITKIRLASFLPALIVAPVIYWLSKLI